MTTVYIYALKDPILDRVRYVGLTRYPEKRFVNECKYGHTLHFRNWISALKGVGKTPIQIILETTTEEKSGEAERKWIRHYKKIYPLLNFTDGGENGFRFSDEARKKISRALLGIKRKPISAEHKKRISDANKGIMRNPNAAAQILASSKARAGKPLSEEHKRKVSEGVKRSMTPEVRAKMSSSRKGFAPHPWTDEQRQRMSEVIKDWHSKNRDTFLENMRKRGATCPQDPITGRFVTTTVSESG